MGRPGLSDDAIWATADGLVKEGKTPSANAVIAIIGGSKNTVVESLSRWRAERAQVAAPSPAMDMPADVAKALTGWMAQTSTAARAKAEEQLVALQEDLDGMIRDGKAAEAREQELIQTVAALTKERDQANAVAETRQQQVEQLLADIDRERDLAGKAQVQAAQEKLRADTQASQVNDMRATIEQLNVRIDEERQARIDADKKAVGLEAERDAARREAAAEQERIKGLQSHLDAAHNKHEQERADYEKRLAAERAATDKANTEAKAVAIENADLKARLVAAEKTISRLEQQTVKAAGK